MPSGDWQSFSDLANDLGHRRRGSARSVVAGRCRVGAWCVQVVSQRIDSWRTVGRDHKSMQSTCADFLHWALIRDHALARAKRDPPPVRRSRSRRDHPPGKRTSSRTPPWGLPPRYRHGRCLVRARASERCCAASRSSLQFRVQRRPEVANRNRCS